MIRKLKFVESKADLLLHSMSEEDSTPRTPRNEGNVKRSSFRVHAIQFFLTYSQCPIPPQEIETFIKGKRPVAHIAVAQELHQDGNYHLHVYVRWQKKYDCSSARAFDYKGYHPKIEGVKNPQAVFNYVRKDGNYIQSFGFDFLDPNNFVKRKNDFEAFSDYVHNQELKEFQGPLMFNNIEYPMSGIKKRHLCIISDPSWGKTEWVENTFYGFQVYKPNGGRYPMDHYMGEKILIFDDHIPKLELLLSASNVYKTKTPVGDTRYNVKFWPMFQERVIIVLLNVLPTYHDTPAFESRFHLIDLRTVKDDIDMYSY